MRASLAMLEVTYANHNKFLARTARTAVAFKTAHYRLCKADEAARLLAQCTATRFLVERVLELCAESFRRLKAHGDVGHLGHLGGPPPRDVGPCRGTTGFPAPSRSRTRTRP